MAIGDNNIDFARFDGSPSNQAPNMAKSVHSDYHHHNVLERNLALHNKMLLSLE